MPGLFLCPFGYRQSCKHVGSLALITLYPTRCRICKRYLEIQNSWKMLMDIVFFIIEKTFYTCLQDDAGIGRIG